MSNYIRGLKRQQIIERWIRGQDDPDYEVFPTKKEGKYIVKRRAEPLETKEEDEEVKPYGRGECLEEHEAYGRGSKSLEDEVNEEPEDEEHEEHEEQKPAPKSKPKPKTQPKRTISKTQPKRTTRGQGPQSVGQTSSDMTVGIEILEQLKLLGEEMKHQRKKKEQKEVIKQVVQKQLTKNPRKRKVIKEEEYSDEYEGSKSLEDETPTPTPQREEPTPTPPAQPEVAIQRTPVFRSRIRNRF